MTELILHIGLPKTGTSTLQHYLAENADALRTQGVIYPKAGRGSIAHHELALACRGVSPLGGNFRRLRRDFIAETSGFERVVVSSEALQSPRGYAGLIAFFGMPGGGGRAFSLKTVCYMREFLDIACSSYAQQVQSSNLSCGIDEFCARSFRGPLAVRARFWRWLCDDVRFADFDRERLINGDVVDDFFAHGGLVMPAPASTRDANPSISGNLLAFKLMANARTQHAPKIYRAFRDLAGLDAAYRGRFHVSVIHAEALRRRHSTYNRTVASLVGSVTQHSFEDGNRLFDMDRWERDLEAFLAHPKLAPLKKDADFMHLVGDPALVAEFGRRIGF